MSNVENLIDQIALGMREAIAAPMEDLADAIRNRISIPVGRDGKGRVTQRSKPGEAPRLETGALRKSIRVEISAPIRALVIVGNDDVRYAKALNDYLSRPIGGDELERHTTAIHDALAASVESIQPGV